MSKRFEYSRFSKIDDTHPLRKAVPQGYVDYQVRKRHDGDVFYFNFALAKEIGLIPKCHPDKLNARLTKVILDTFSLVIVNEYDVIHQSRFSDDDILNNSYMAVSG
ncbi:MAG: hypothetical protein ACE5EH_11490 [Gammaproteobacteria bacterium]